MTINARSEDDLDIKVITDKVAKASGEMQLETGWTGEGSRREGLEEEGARGEGSRRGGD